MACQQALRSTGANDSASQRSPSSSSFALPANQGLITIAPLDVFVDLNALHR
jgi:hypothetical protein